MKYLNKLTVVLILLISTYCTGSSPIDVFFKGDASLKINRYSLELREDDEAGIFSFSLASKPSAPVSIVFALQTPQGETLTAAENTEFILSGSSLTFTPEDYNVVQTISVQPLNDCINDGDRELFFYTEKITSSDKSYNLENNPLLLTRLYIKTIDTKSTTPDLILHSTRETLRTTENGGVDQLVVALSCKPDQNVAVSLASSDQAEGKLDSTQITLDQTNYNTGQLVRLSGVSDCIDEEDRSYSVNAVTASTQASFDGLTASRSAVNINHGRGPEIILNGATSREVGQYSAWVAGVTCNPTDPPEDITLSVSLSDGMQPNLLTSASLVFNGNEPLTAVDMIIHELTLGSYTVTVSSPSHPEFFTTRQATVNVSGTLTCELHSSLGLADTADGFAGGDGTATSPHLICSPAHLVNMAGRINDSPADFKSDHYEIQADIDLAGTAITPAGYISDCANPLEDSGFSGSLEGNGSTLSNLSYTNTTNGSCAGLFGYVNGATISNLTISNASLSAGSGMASVYTGTIAGRMNNSTLDNVTVTTIIEGIGITGGLVAWADNLTASNVTANAIITTADTTTTKTGGMFGHLFDSTLSTATAAIKIAAIGRYNGGIAAEIKNVQMNDITVNNSPSVVDGEYGLHAMTDSATQTVYTSNTGGIAGVDVSILDAPSSLSDITIDLTILSDRGNYVAGIIGEGGSYLTVDTCTLAGSVISARTAALVSPYSSYGGGYTGSVSGSMYGDEAEAVEAKVLNCHSTMDVSAVFTSGGLVGTAGTIRIENSSYNGIIDASTGDNIGGITGEVFYSTVIKDTHTGGNYTGTSETAGITGRLFDSEIINCYSTATINGLANSGGLVGEMYDSTITDSYATGNVTGSREAGGLVGRVDSLSTITASYASGNVTGDGNKNAVPESSDNNVGGLVGLLNNSTISRSYASGTVLGYQRVGGLVGLASGGAAVESSYANGQVAGYTISGGLIGQLTASTVERSYFYFDTDQIGVRSDSLVAGGLVGQSDGDNTAIDDSFAIAYVNAESYAGGLAGYISDTHITSSYSSGLVVGATGNVGGLVGATTVQVNRPNRITMSFSHSPAGNPLNLMSAVGGLVGLAQDTDIINSYATGLVDVSNSGTNNSIGGFVGVLHDANATSSINYSYSTGTVSASYSATIGGFCGSSSGTISNSRYIDTAWPQTDPCGAGFIGSAWLQSSTFMSGTMGFNTFTIWMFDGSINNGYPILKDFYSGSSAIWTYDPGQNCGLPYLKDTGPACQP